MLPYNPTLEKAAVPQEDDIVNAARRLVREEGLMAVEVVLPRVDMAMETGSIQAWKVTEGQAVKEGDPLRA